MAQTQVRAEQLPDYIGSYVVGHDVLTKAAIVAGGDIVVVQFGDGFSRREATFAPGDVLTVETE